MENRFKFNGQADPSGHSCDKDANGKHSNDGQERGVPLLPAPEPLLALPGPVMEPPIINPMQEMQRAQQLRELSAPEPVLALPGPVLDNYVNRTSGPDVEEPNNRRREDSGDRDYSIDFEDLAAYRRQQGMPVAGSADDKDTASKLIMGDDAYFGRNGHGKLDEIKRVFNVNAQTATHAEGDVFYQAKVAGNTSTTAILITDRRACKACG